MVQYCVMSSYYILTVTVLHCNVRYRLTDEYKVHSGKGGL